MKICGLLGSLCSRFSISFAIVVVVLLSGGSVESRAQGIATTRTSSLGLTCSLSTDSIYPGDPVSIEGVVPGFTSEEAKERLSFTWTGDLQVSGNGATVILTPVTPGRTRIHGKVTLKSDPTRFAECDVNFTVKAFEPPTISCSANPSTVRPGEASAISASASSPRNRPLSYSYSSSAGSVSGNGTSATLSPGGATGTIAVTCNVVDDKGQYASATTTVSVLTITAPPPQSLPPFPWPPPVASDRIKIPITLGGPGLKKLGEVDTKILAALTQLGYVQRAHYWIPNGYVLITRVEQIGKDGVAKPEPYRFSDQLPSPDSVTSYLGGLFTSRPGYFRIIAFVITKGAFNDNGPPLNLSDAFELLRGPAALPAPVAAQAVPQGAEVTALIYEYQKATVDSETPAVPIHSTVSARTHLERAGLWQLLSQH
jgi:hypothetical protein